jgi:hypothetical protein
VYDVVPVMLGVDGSGGQCTSVRRRISLLSRSWGLFEQIWRQICLGNAVNVSRSARRLRGGRQPWGACQQRVDDPTVLRGNRFLVGLIEHRMQQGAYPRPRRLRVIAIELVVQWVRQCCQAAPGGVAPIAATKPASASEVTSRTPEIPRPVSEPRR